MKEKATGERKLPGFCCYLRSSAFFAWNSSSVIAPQSNRDLYSLIQYNTFFGIYVKRYANAAGYHQSFFGKVNEYCGKGFDARLTSISPSMQAQQQ